VNEPETAVWMGRLVELSRTEGALPDPAVIWWKARLLEKQAAQARVVRPMLIAQWASLVVAIVTMAVLCAGSWTSISGLLAPAGVALWLAAGACAIVMVLALRFVFAE
jgi:ABC-type Co2+ transport system permease subunit